HGHEIVTAALRWARHRGAETAWLQVESANTAAVALYKGLGFGEVYRYAYRQKPGY
ncbi:MAG: GCN5 family acetyltransferase, partial [Hoeflea sp. BRH_c9]